MSHVAAIDMVVKDLSALKAACPHLGLEFRENQCNHKWYGRWVDDYHGGDAAFKFGVDPANYGQCHHAIGIPGNDKAYEVGVIAQPDGTYKLVWDFFANGYGLLEKIGRKGELLKQRYALEVTAKVLAKKGLKVVSTEPAKNGKLRVVLRGPG
jgi:hypothetical protein